MADGRRTADGGDAKGGFEWCGGRDEKLERVVQGVWARELKLDVRS
jgi:hypothetical protein